MLPLIFTFAALTSPATPADGTYTYVSTMNGTAVGKTSITVSHAPAGLVIVEKGGGSFNGQSAAFQDTLDLDNTLAPSAYNSSASYGDRAMKGSLTFNGATATEQGESGTQTYDLAADAKHFVVLDLGPFSGWFALPAQMTAWNYAPVIAIAPVMGHGFPLAPAAVSGAQRPKGVPAGDVSMGVKAPVEFTVWYDPKTLLVDRLDIPMQGVAVTRTP